MKKIVLPLAVAVLAWTGVQAQTEWKLDKSHSKIQFTVEHLMISEVTGEFEDYSAEVTTDGDNWEGADIKFTAQVSSIDTDNDKRDQHLVSEDFFYASNYPEIKFESTSFKKVSGKTYRLEGNLTMRGVTKKIALDAVHNGTVKDPWGNTVAGFRITGTIDRTNYGLEWNKTLEAGGVLVGETIEITCDIELQKS